MKTEYESTCNLSFSVGKNVTIWGQFEIQSYCADNPNSLNQLTSWFDGFRQGTNSPFERRYLDHHIADTNQTAQSNKVQTERTEKRNNTKSNLMLRMIRVHVFMEEVPHVGVRGITERTLEAEPVDVNSR